MKISDHLIISKKTITAYNKTCESVLEKYDISQVSFDTAFIVGIGLAFLISFIGH